ncbi:F-box domain-containing protein [Entamoeba marina]
MTLTPELDLNLVLPEIEFDEFTPLQPTTPFDLLTDDTIYAIITHLSPRDIHSFSQTCRRVWHVAGRDDVWTTLALEQTGVETTTRTEAIEALLQKQHILEEEATLEYNRTQEARHNAIETYVFVIRDLMNFIGVDITTISIGFIGIILSQLILDGYIDIGWWIPLICFFPMVFLTSFIPLFNCISTKYSGDPDPPVRWFSSPLQTTRYFQYSSARGVGLLTEPCIVITYFMLFIISIGGAGIIIVPGIVVWLAAWIFFGIFTLDRRLHIVFWRGCHFAPAAILLLISLLLITLKCEDVLNMSWHLTFTPIYLLLLMAFIIPSVYFLFFCCLCACGKNLNQDSFCGNFCCVDISASDLAALKNLFIMLMVSIICPFTLTFLALLATNLNGTDDIPLCKRYEMTHL